MTRFSEPEILLPALHALAAAQSGLTTSQAIVVLTAAMRPTGPDLLPTGRRKDSRFSQQVRNLFGSHKRLERLEFAVSSGARGVFRITAAGLAFLTEAEPNDAALRAQGVTGDALRRERAARYEDVVVEEGTEVTRTARQRQRSRLLRQAAINELRRRTGGLPCSSCGFDFEVTYGELGREYVEMHHRVPLHTADATAIAISAAIDDGRLIPLCSNCHRMIHRLPARVPSLADLRAALAGAAGVPPPPVRAARRH